ncbi:MAG: protein-(glutamine-N5) methyltransferase, release factor-specific [Oscillatoriales cyanobacterium CG2_30_44_21]|nr:MAG: protein-(glutamine-N5) methyltransferase, release factor-specific [Oscillatoriales cyanobacterium CG2_30_44_21]
MDFYEWYDRSLVEAHQHNVPKYELEYLAISLLGLTKLDLRLRSPNIEVQIDSQKLIKLDQAWQERCRDRVPVQYLIGSVIWRDLELQVSPAVLIPRPETELIIDIAADFINQNNQSLIYQKGDWLDLGTGSGAIAIALAKMLPQSQIYAVDISESALELAKENAYRNMLTNQQINFYLGNYFEPISQLNLQNKFVGMISNPPYIPSFEVLNLQPEVVNHEPHLALSGGDDGLDAIRELVNTAPNYLISQGFWIIELMSGQASIVRSLLLDNGCYGNIEIHQDYAGIERFVSAQMTKPMM